MLAVSLLVLGLICVSCSEIDIIHYSDPYDSPPPPKKNWNCNGRPYYGPHPEPCDYWTEERKTYGQPCLEQCYPPGPSKIIYHNQYFCYCKPEYCREQTYGRCVPRP